MKKLLSLLLLCVSPVFAQTLTANPYPATGVQPDTAEYTINGGAPIPCVLVNLPAGKEPQCSLDNITAIGTYTLIMTVRKAVSIVNTPDGATVSPASSASSNPFVYVLSGSVLAKPANVKVTFP